MEISHHNCATLINDTDIGTIRQVMADLFNNHDKSIIAQRKYIERLGIIFDGKAHVRLQNAALKLLKK